MREFVLTSECAEIQAYSKTFRLDAEKLGLQVTLDSTLATIPGSVHLHMRKRGEKSGTLEFTADPTTGRAWLSVHENRTKPWVWEVIEALCEVR